MSEYKPMEVIKELTEENRNLYEEIARLRAENVKLVAYIDKLKDYIDFHGLRHCMPDDAIDAARKEEPK